MRIVLLVENLESYGGLEEIVTSLAIALKSRGHKTSVLSTVWIPPENQYRQLLQEKRIPFVQWPIMRPLSFLAFLRTGVPALLKQRSWSQASLAMRRWRDEMSDHLGWRFVTSGQYKRWTKRLLALWHRYWRPDILHVNCYTYDIGLAFLLNWTQQKGVATLFQEHQTPDAKSIIWKSFCLDINKATCVAAVSQKSAQILCDKLNVSQPIFVVPPIVAVPALSLGRQAISVEANKKTLTISSIARMIPVKGLTYLLKAISQLLRVRPDLEFRIYGDGPLRQDLIDYATQLGLDWEKIFIGSFKHKELADIMLETDIFVLASVREGLPLSVIEAMAYSRPIVSTAVGGIPEIIEDGKTGLLCSPGDPTCLAEKLKILIDEPEKRVQLGQAARAAYEQGPFHPDAVCERFEFVYREVLSVAGPAQAKKLRME